MADNTTRLQLAIIPEGTVRGEILHNENMQKIDAALFAVVKSIGATPPGNPVEGEHYIVASSGATGSWSGKGNNMAIYAQGWVFIAPRKGMSIYVEGESCEYHYNGTAWVKAGPIVSLTQTISATPTQSEVNNIQTKVNEIITQLRATGKIKP